MARVFFQEKHHDYVMVVNSVFNSQPAIGGVWPAELSPCHWPSPCFFSPGAVLGFCSEFMESEQFGGKSVAKTRERHGETEFYTIMFYKLQDGFTSCPRLRRPTSRKSLIVPLGCVIQYIYIYYIYIYIYIFINMLIMRLKHAEDAHTGIGRCSASPE